MDADGAGPLKSRVVSNEVEIFNEGGGGKYKLPPVARSSDFDAGDVDADGAGFSVNFENQK